MASAAMFSSLRRRRSPFLEAFLVPADLSDAGVLGTMRAISAELATTFSGKHKTTPFCQRKNSRSLIRKIQVISLLLDYFSGVEPSRISPTAFLCFKELYLLLHRSVVLIDCVKGSSKLWLLLQNQSISGHFHDMNQEISTLLDVFPLDDEVVNLPRDTREQIELLRKQSIKSSELSVDKHDELLRQKLYHFLNEFENGRIPEKDELYSFFVRKLGIRSVKTCREEIEFLEEQIVSHDGDLDPPATVLNGFVALIRYCRYLLFRFEDEEAGLGKPKRRPAKKISLITKEIADTFVKLPKDFTCPISLDLMRDPVIISTGQTYDRPSITRWIDDGHSTCPKSGQTLVHTKLIPNRSLRSLILQWCTANNIPYDPPENPDFLEGQPSRASIEATRATARLLVDQLKNGSALAKTVSAWEIRLLAKTGRHNRASIAQSGAIPLLKTLLNSPDPLSQENSVTALLNLSIYEENKSRIMNEPGCLTALVDVLQNGHTTEARENAAATLFSLSSIHSHKTRIAREKQAVESLTELLKNGTPRGRKDAVTALFNLSTHAENVGIMVESGAVKALIEALGCDDVAEDAAGALAIVVRRPEGAEAVGREESVVVGLMGMMGHGSPRGKENAVAALLELCRGGGPMAAERVVRAPALGGLLQSLLFTGTKRARRKAASLAKVFRRCENGYSGLGVNGSSRDVSLSVSVSISV
ncbi:U-box domain-containing protein 17 [Striga hermonthica]|uniref:RING-type E3 ubiquitin transferase n=1 Tax=Striga hermonthica TaxID=68872 RepID=A0A9N7R9A4_STRHE|nr:U-box domain-containing protein 17 [Striga hermonthica]